MKLFIFLLILISIPVFAQYKLEEIKIIEGKWKLDVENIILFEEWKKVNETIFEGLSYRIEDGEKKVVERLHLLELYDHIVYIAQPGTNQPTLFTLISTENKKFIFENKEHDFPQRVIYHFISENTLYAWIEGEINGEPKRDEYNFIRSE